MARYSVEFFPADDDPPVREFTADGFTVTNVGHLLFVNMTDDGEGEIVGACAGGWGTVHKIGDTPSAREVDAQVEEFTRSLRREGDR